MFVKQFLYFCICGVFMCVLCGIYGQYIITTDAVLISFVRTTNTSVFRQCTLITNNSCDTNQMNEILNLSSCLQTHALQKKSGWSSQDKKHRNTHVFLLSKSLFPSMTTCTQIIFPNNENPSSEKNSAYNNQWNGNRTFLCTETKYGNSVFICTQ